MIQELTRKRILQSLAETRPEMKDLLEKRKFLKEEYYNLAFDTLSDDERRFYEIIKEKYPDKEDRTLIMQQAIYLGGLFPSLIPKRKFFETEEDIKEAKRRLMDLGYNTELLTGTNDLSDSYFRNTMRFLDCTPYNIFSIEYDKKFPIFGSIRMNADVIEEFKSRFSQENYNRFFKVTSEYIDAVLLVATLFVETSYFLYRPELTLERIRKDFPELYKEYEDSKR